MINRRDFYRLLTLLAMKKFTLMNESVTETGGVFEDLEAVRELQALCPNPTSISTTTQSKAPQQATTW